MSYEQYLNGQNGKKMPVNHTQRLSLCSQFGVNINTQGVNPFHATHDISHLELLAP